MFCYICLFYSFSAIVICISKLYSFSQTNVVCVRLHWVEWLLSVVVCIEYLTIFLNELCTATGTVWHCHYVTSRPSLGVALIGGGATTMVTGETVPPTFRLGDWSPNFLAVVFKNEYRSHQNAGFSIWVFNKFSGMIPPDLDSGRGRPPPALTAPVLGPKPWSPSTLQPCL